MSLNRILHIDTETGWRGGQLQVFYLLRELERRGYKTFLISPPGSSLVKKVAELKTITQYLTRQQEWNLLALLKIYNFLKVNHIQLVHLHTGHAHTLGALAGKMAGIPVVVTRRVDFPLAHPFFSYLKYNLMVDKIIAISQGVKKVLLKGGVPKDQITVIPSGIDSQRFSNIRKPEYLYQEFKLSPENIIIGTVAHLTDHKGHRYLIEAIPRILEVFPQARFLFVGEGELRSQLEAMNRKLGIEDKVVLTGFREDIPEILSILNLFVLPSHLEGLCTSLMDAMYMGIPIIATTAGGISEIVEDGKSGLLVPPKNPEFLAEAVIKLLEDKSRQEKFSKEGRKRVIQKFEILAVVEKIEQVYQQLMNSNQ